MDMWNEIRTAAMVAREGTVSGAAKELGVHRATVNRHIESLEVVLGGKLFQRSARGYLPTDLGVQLLKVADSASEKFEELLRHAQRQSDQLDGELVITSVDMLAPEILPVINRVAAQHHQLKLRYTASDTLLKLEYGEAHVAFRVGAKPEDPDNVVQPYESIKMGLYASTAYVRAHGKPESIEEFSQHRFIGPASEAPRAKFLTWLVNTVPDVCITFISNAGSVRELAVKTGTGIGFLPVTVAREDPDLIEVLASKPEWDVSVWVVTHVDLHRSPKVQAFLEALRSSKD